MTISAAHAAVTAAEHGEGGLFLKARYAEVPGWQFKIWFSDLAPRCPYRVSLGVERRPGNALNVEIGAPLPRCSLRSPDGRGIAWVASGGSWLAYGACDFAECAGTRGELKCRT